MNGEERGMVYHGVLGYEREGEGKREREWIDGEMKGRKGGRNG